MPSYSNGRIPLDLLVVFQRGWNATDGNWYHALSPATYARHLALVERARKRTGRKLVISGGWSAYRPYEAQVLARQIHGNWAAVPGTSSHGGFWEGRQTLAMDYGNWAYVYGNGDGKDTPDKRAAFFDDVRAVGLSPHLISPQRGYPDEPWHVVDLNPWSAVPAGLDTTPFEEDEMTPEQARQLNSIFNAIFDGGNSMKDGGKSISQSLRDIQDKLAPVTRGGKPVSIRQEIADTKTTVLTLQAQNAGLLEAIKQIGAGKVDLAAIQAAAEAGAREALGSLRVTIESGE